MLLISFQQKQGQVSKDRQSERAINIKQKPMLKDNIKHFKKERM